MDKELVKGSMLPREFLVNFFNRLSHLIREVYGNIETRCNYNEILTQDSEQIRVTIFVTLPINKVMKKFHQYLELAKQNECQNYFVRGKSETFFSRPLLMVPPTLCDNGEIAFRFVFEIEKIDYILKIFL